MKRLSQQFMPTAIILMFILGACSDSVETQSYDPIDAGYTPQPDAPDVITTLPEDVVGPSPGEGAKLTHVDELGEPEVGDDGVACVVAAGNSGGPVQSGRSTTIRSAFTRCAA